MKTIMMTALLALSLLATHRASAMGSTPPPAPVKDKNGWTSDYYFNQLPATAENKNTVEQIQACARENYGLTPNADNNNWQKLQNGLRSLRTDHPKCEDWVKSNLAPITAEVGFKLEDHIACGDSKIKKIIAAYTPETAPLNQIVAIECDQCSGFFKNIITAIDHRPDFCRSTQHELRCSSLSVQMALAAAAQNNCQMMHTYCDGGMPELLAAWYAEKC